MADDIREDAAAQNDGLGKQASGLSGGKAEKADNQGKDSSNPESLPAGCQPEIGADGKDGGQGLSLFVICTRINRLPLQSSELYNGTSILIYR